MLLVFVQTILSVCFSPLSIKLSHHEVGSICPIVVCRVLKFTVLLPGGQRDGRQPDEAYDDDLGQVEGTEATLVLLKGNKSVIIKYCKM